MSKVTFQPGHLCAEVSVDTKLLVAAKKAKAPLRSGCAACRCGTCAVKVDSALVLSAMKDDEIALLSRMKLSTDGSVRLSCQARVLENIEVTVDLAFQDTYSPDDGDDDY